MTAVLEQLPELDALVPDMATGRARPNFRLVVERERKVFTNIEREGRLERRAPDGTWQPYANNAFRQLLTTPGFELPALVEMLTDITREGPMETEQRLSDRLAAISRRQMARLAPTAPKEEPPMETHEVKNGVGKHKPGTHYSAEARAQMVEGFREAADKREYAASLGVHLAMLYRWARTLGKPDARPAKPDRTGSNPAKPAKTRAARTTSPDRELDVLRQLLELPADARERIVAYLTARGR